MFKLIDYNTTDPATKGIGVASLHTDGSVYLATYGIPVADDPDVWIAANEAMIAADLPTDRKLNTASLARHILDVESSGGSVVIPELDDIADIYPDIHASKILKAFILILLDEINILRTEAALPLRTITQFKTAMKNKLETLA